MKARKYKTPAFQATYDSMLAAAHDKISKLYLDGEPHRRSHHNRAFWDGYGGIKKSDYAVPGTDRVVCFSAGKDFAKINPGIAVDEASWIRREQEAFRKLCDSVKLKRREKFSGQPKTVSKPVIANVPHRGGTKEQAYVVYVIRNDQTKRLYVGSTRDVVTRWSTHKRESSTVAM